MRLVPRCRAAGSHPGTGQLRLVHVACSSTVRARQTSAALRCCMGLAQTKPRQLPTSPAAHRAASSSRRLRAMSSRTDWWRQSCCLNATRSLERCGGWGKWACLAGNGTKWRELFNSTRAWHALAPTVPSPRFYPLAPPTCLHQQRQRPLAHADQAHAVVQAAGAQAALRNLKAAALACSREQGH